MSKKILLADDSITIQKVIELTFSDEDFDVVTVGNGRLALEKLPEVQPDVVLCDIIMPEKDGYEVCEHIKQSGTFSHVPVLLLTGAFEPFDQERAAQVGSDGFLAKPFEPETLIAKVKDLLSRAPAPSAEAAAATVSPVSPAPSPPAPPAFEPEPFEPEPVPFEPEPVPFEPEPASFEPEPASFEPEPASFEPEPVAFETEAPAPEPPEPALPEQEAVAFEPEPPTFDPAPPDPSEPPGPITEAFDESPAASDEPGLGPSFIPEEPYETFEEATFEASEVSEEQPSLAPVTAEESATLSGTPAVGGSPAEESTSTVMFAASDLSWGGGEPDGAADSGGATGAPQPQVDGQDEPTLTPEPVETAGPGEESEAFEEVLEEDAGDEGPEAGAPELPGPTEEPSAELEGPPTLKTAVPSPLHDEMSRAFAEPVEPEPPVASAYEQEFEPEELEPAPELEPEPETIPPIEPASAAEGAGGEAERTLPGTSRADVVESFADIDTGGETEETTAAPPSEAASVSVPVDMVEKIAQRVVAQVSEKVVREIVWEVVPDLAEALIKQEIDRLKAELEKL